jgi:malonyl-CoA decarboxylase
VEVALTAEMPDAISPLLNPTRSPLRPRDATTAVFYSISNTQAGLGGVSFGHFLIKQVAEDLKRDLPNLRTFVTLSPVPGFAGWLEAERRDGEAQFVPPEEQEALATLAEPGWQADPGRTETVRRPLVRAAATYLTRAKNGRGRPLDPVARFHLGNGARLERLNFLGDTSAKGLRQSHGVMVNYCYDLDEIERNHEAYAEKGEVIASSAVRKLVRSDLPARDLAPAT